MYQKSGILLGKNVTAVHDQVMKEIQEPGLQVPYLNHGCMTGLEDIAILKDFKTQQN